MNSYICITLIIILLFPFMSAAHGIEPSLRSDPGKLPGEVWYWFERPAEWIEVNLFTISTKKKQEKRFEFASERVAEMGGLLYLAAPSEKNLDLALRRFRYFLESAEDMAEKIIFLDGAEIAVAEKFEAETRHQEKFLRELKEEENASEFEPQISEALGIAREQNAKIFRFMVKKYQGSEQDIKKHQDIISKHMALVREVLGDIEDQDKLREIENLLVEAEKFRKAGLNIEAYGFINQAKVLIY